LAVSIGCPSGIGPEVSVAAASRVRDARIILVGDAAVVSRAADAQGMDLRRLVKVEANARPHLQDGEIGVLQPGASLAPRDSRPGQPSSLAGAAQLAWIDAACDLVRARLADALVTGPVSKSVIASSGSREATRFLGHTEHLARRLHSAEVVMAFVSERFTTALVTTHLPLSKVPRAITADAVSSATFWLADLLSRLAPAGTCPRIAVASLNPHAGEGGLLGREETLAIVPGIRRAHARARRARLDVSIAGPVPAETAFRLAAKRGYEGVVAMYHDQATIPMKLLGFGEAVNVSLGLPIIRTSVDHGTAYDIAGTGRADARGMAAAMDLGVRLAQPRVSGASTRTPRRRPPRRTDPPRSA
jgi:4-hydroxythreonine-4-phosphate dehydrogenase